MSLIRSISQSPNLRISESCTTCNLGFSASEEYLACLLECIKHGTTTPNETFRPKIAATLKARPALSARIEAAKYTSNSGATLWRPEDDRVREVVLKLARGHLSYELGIQRTDAPLTLQVTPLLLMSDEERQSFFDIESAAIYPEIGSRSFINCLSGKPTAYENWLVVQELTYAYAVGQGDGNWVKILIREYLACHVTWD
ncbi:hypothetical protein [Azonexus sp. IMCC34839]|uniref:hypothetical protein n=1 Tax=Azonexus sp. IMCC34839 TaxID=3133695 RepID=UPI003999C9C2